MNCLWTPVHSSEKDYPQPGCLEQPAQVGAMRHLALPQAEDVRRYTLAGLCLGLALAASLAVQPLWGDRNPFVFFFVAVLVAVQLGGVRLFLVTLLSSEVLVAWFILPPQHSLLIAGTSNQLKALVFAVVGWLLLYFTEQARRALAREQAARDELRRHAAALAESQERFEHLFEGSPAPTWVEDWVALTNWLEAVRGLGVEELTAYLEDDPERVRQAVGLVRVLNVNEAALRLTRASSKAELTANLPKLFTRDTYRSFTQLLEALWANQPHIETECECRRLDGRPLHLMVRMDVPRQGPEQAPDFAKVIVTATDVTERKLAEHEREKLVGQLQQALAEVKTLSGLLPICAHCKRIRDDQGYWNQIELYIRRHSNAKFSHGICPDCSRKLYPELFPA